MGGVRPNASENGQIAGSDAIRDGRNARGTAQPACGFRGTPPSATVYAVPGFIRGMSVYYGLAGVGGTLGPVVSVIVVPPVGVLPVGVLPVGVVPVVPGGPVFGPPEGVGLVWPEPPPPPPTLPVVTPPATAAKFTTEPCDWVTTPVPETVKLLPPVTVVVCPLLEVNVALPSVTLNFTPHSSGFCPGRHGMTIISTTAAIDIVAGSTNKPAKMSVLVHLCLNMTRCAPSLHLLPSQ
jgi:hypothetical protein